MPSTRASRTDVRPASPLTKRVLLASLMVAMALAAMEATITATSVPSIIAELGGIEFGAWVFAGFLLAQAVTTPLYGSLADRIGRKPVLLTGIVVFLAGALASGFATSIVALIGFRVLQGAGAGAIHSTVSTLAGDLYPLEHRGRVQALLSSVWGLSAIAGPLVGSAAVALLGWPWVFWINVPVGLVALIGIAATLRERIEPVARRLDVGGGLIIFAATGALMVGITLASEGQRALGLTLVATGLLLFVTFAGHARRAAAPIIPVVLFTDRFLRTANVATFVAGIANVAFLAYVPSFVQFVLGAAPLVAGLAFTTLSIGWPIASFVSGRWLTIYGVRRPARVGGLFVALGCTLLALLPAVGTPIWAATASLTTGLGLGLLLTGMTVAIQTVVPWSQRAVATSTNMLMRHMGSAVGAAAFGALFALGHATGFETGPPSTVVEIVSSGSTRVFVAAAIIGWCVCALAWRIPERAIRGDAASTPTPTSAAKSPT